MRWVRPSNRAFLRYIEEVLPTLGEVEQRMWKTAETATKMRPMVCQRVELNAFTTPQLIDHITKELENKKHAPPKRSITETSPNPGKDYSEGF